MRRVRRKGIAWILLAAAVAGCATAPPAPAGPVCPPGGVAGCLPFADEAQARGVTHVTAPHTRAVYESLGMLDNVSAPLDPSLAAQAPAPAPDTVGGAPGGGYGGGALSSWLFDSLAGGVSLGDADGDGSLDLYFADQGPDHLYLNDGAGHFSDATSWIGAAGDGNGRAALFFDADNDGWQDLFVCNLRDPSRLLRNDGGRGGHGFTDISDEAGVGRASACQGAAAADVDNDGLLDLLVVDYFQWWRPGAGPSATDADQPEILYRNLGGLRFADVTDAWGLAGDGPTLAGAFADYDGDGWQDLALINDFSAPSSLWHNEAGQRFRRLDAATGFSMARAGMSATWADLDGDGRLDLYVSNIFEGPATTPKGNVLFRNNGDGTFSDVAHASGTDDGLWAWGVAALDADADGDLDLFVADGFSIAHPVLTGIAAPPPPGPGRSPFAVTSVPGRHEPKRFFENLGNGTFAERAAAWGLTVPIEGRAAAAGDWDGDGAVDLVLTGVPEVPLLLRNRAPQGRAIELRLQGTASNRDAVGAVVSATLGNRTLALQREAGSGFESQSSPVLHIGLGAAPSADLRVRWPSGQVQDLGAVDAGRYVLVEGGPVSSV